MVPVGSLLLGDQNGSFCCSILLRGPVLGNPEVSGHAADALAHSGHFTSLRGSKGWGHTAPAAGGGSGAGSCSLVGRLDVAAWI